MLVAGELDAVLHTDLIDPFIEGNPAVARLFPDHKAEEIGYFKKTGIFPIMHVTAIRRRVLERHPWVAINLYKALEESKAIAMKRLVNPRIVPLAWHNEHREEQEALLGKDPWEYGLSPRNRNTLETMIGYSHEQGLISRKLTLDELFLDVSEGRKRGTSRV